MRARVLRAARAAKFGGIIGLSYFLADLVGASFAVGFLFDPRPKAFVLLAFAAGVTTLVGASAGFVIGAAWPPSRPVQLAPGKRLPLALLGMVAVAIGGYAIRVDRQVAAPATRPDVAAERPVPVLFVVMDTLRADTAYGNQLDFAHAPNLGRYAKRNHLFIEAEATAGWTIPSMAAMLTGIHNLELDASAGALPSYAPTLTEYLAHAGYESHAIVDNMLVEPRAGFAKGFESYIQSSGYRFAFTFPGFRLPGRALLNPLRWWSGASYLGAAGITDRALDRIAGEHEAPLFLYVHYMDPHEPYLEHPELGGDAPGSEPMDYYYFRETMRNRDDVTPTKAQMLWIKHRYDQEVTHLDKHVGRLLAAWHDRFGDDSLVVLTSDHGEEFLDHGYLGHAYTVYRELVHVPLIMHLPTSLQPQSSTVHQELVSLLDLTPTVLDVISPTRKLVHDGPQMHGTSWVPWLLGQDAPPTRPTFATHARHGHRVYRHREGSHVLMREVFFDKRAPNLAYYDLGADPTEQHDLLKHETKPQGFSDHYSRAIATIDAFWLSFLARQEGKPQEDTTETLKALGYIQ